MCLQFISRKLIRLSLHHHFTFKIGKYCFIQYMGYSLSDAWSRVNWADLMAAQGAFGTDFYDRSTRTKVGTMLWTENRPAF